MLRLRNKKINFLVCTLMLDVSILRILFSLSEVIIKGSFLSDLTNDQNFFILEKKEIHQTRHLIHSFKQGWAENSIPGIYQWNLPVFPGMANKAQVANTGK